MFLFWSKPCHRAFRNATVDAIEGAIGVFAGIRPNDMAGSIALTTRVWQNSGDSADIHGGFVTLIHTKVAATERPLNRP
jgi:hypothetical protein